MASHITSQLVPVLRIDARQNITRDAVFCARAFTPERQPEQASRYSDDSKNTGELF